MERLFLISAGAFGALGVALGAFGAHGLRPYLTTLADGADRRVFWETAAHYHLIHALALGLAAFAAGRSQQTTSATVAGFAFMGGIVCFSGSLYVMTLTGIRAFGAVTPVGGVLFIVGWLAIARSAWQSR